MSPKRGERPPGGGGSRPEPANARETRPELQRPPADPPKPQPAGPDDAIAPTLKKAKDAYEAELTKLREPILKELNRRKKAIEDKENFERLQEAETGHHCIREYEQVSRRRSGQGIPQRVPETPGSDGKGLRRRQEGVYPRKKGE